MSNGGILGENWCVLLQVGHVQLTGAPQSVDYEPGKLATASPFGPGLRWGIRTGFTAQRTQKPDAVTTMSPAGCPHVNSFKVDNWKQNLRVIYQCFVWSGSAETRKRKVTRVTKGGWSALRRPWRTVRHTVFVYVWAAVACVTAPRPSKNTNIIHTNGWFQTIKYQHHYPTD